MKVLALRQPWAQLVLDGLKTIETRKWNTPYRGELYIYASKEFDAAIPRSTQKILHAKAHDYRINFLAPTGVMLCKVDLVDVRKMTRTDDVEACIAKYPGAYAFIIKNVRLVKNVELPASVKWRLGIFNVPDNLLEI
jgi:hypothetical protein